MQYKLILNNTKTMNTELGKVNISAEDLETLRCESCGGFIFSEGLIIKTVSPLLTGNGKEGMLPVPAFYCVNCKKPVDKYLPADLREVKIKI